MRALVLSDTHRSLNRVVKLLYDIGNELDLVIHLGDNTEDAAFIKENFKLPVLNVAGNCDNDTAVADELIEDIGGKKVYMTHGHKYSIKYGNADELYTVRLSSRRTSAFSGIRIYRFCRSYAALLL